MLTRLLPSLLLTLALALGCSSGCDKEVSAELATAPKAALNRAAAACGGKGQPDCPLQEWMKATLQTYQRAGNFERLERSLLELQTRAPPGYAGWADVAAAGVKAAHKQDEAALRQVCKDCHETHRARYRRERRAEPLL